jgi:hypothetical protein
MRITKEQLIDKMKSMGFMLNPFGESYYSFKIVINNCAETTYYFIEAEDPFKEEPKKAGAKI